MVDVTFDESNGSQVEQVNSSVVGNEEPPCEAIKQLAIGDIRLQENKATGVEPPQAEAATKTTAKAGAAVPLTLAEVLPSSTAAQRSSTTTPLHIAAANSSPIHGQNLQHDDGQSEDEETT